MNFKKCSFDLVIVGGGGAAALAAVAASQEGVTGGLVTKESSLVCGRGHERSF